VEGPVNLTRSGLTNPVIAVAGGQYAVGTALNQGGGTFVFTIVVGAAVGTAIPFFIFDVPSSADPHFGLQMIPPVPLSPWPLPRSGYWPLRFGLLGP
jgi:hypothetical protein